MASLNKVMIIGNLGRDPEVRQAGESKVANFTVAVTERFTDSSGQRQERTEWVNVVVWRKLAEISQQYLRKGSQVYVEGRLQTRSWDDQNGQKKYMTEVVADNFQMLGRREGGDAPQEHTTPTPGPAFPPPATAGHGFSRPDVPADDLPF